MKLYEILFIFILLIGLSSCGDKFHTRTSLQDYVDKFVDVVKFKQEGISSLNKTAIRQIWSFFKAKYRRFYSSTGEERERLRIFRDQLQYVLETNLQKSLTYKLGLNHFSDWTSEEYQRMVNGSEVPSRFRRSLINDEPDEDPIQRSLAKLYQRHYYARRDKNNHYTSQLTNAFDWRTKNVVGPIKDQGTCGSCYAFATVAVMESLYAIKTNSQKVTQFSEEQIIDCSSNGNMGCCGGYFSASADYLLGKGGRIATATSYPYTKKEDRCHKSNIVNYRFEPSAKFLSEKGGQIATEASYPFTKRADRCHKNNVNDIKLGQIAYERLARGNEKKLAEAVANYGPIYVSLDAHSTAFRYYRSGVLQINGCGVKQLGHDLAMVGYGYDKTLQKPYWIIKNSWGKDWGEKGYLRLLKDGGNMCGIATQAYSAKLR